MSDTFKVLLLGPFLDEFAQGDAFCKGIAQAFPGNLRLAD